MAIEGLIAQYHLNESIGLSAKDSSGYGNDGTLESSMTDDDWVPGKSGNCLDFDGIDDQVSCGNSSPLDQLGNGSFSISFWIKSKDTVPLNYGVIFSKYQREADRWLIDSVGTTNQLRLYFQSSGIIATINFNAAPFDTLFNHIVLTVNRTTEKALGYLNTAKDAQELDISGLPADITNTSAIAFGSRNDGTFPYEGLIDEINIFNRVLTEADISKLFYNPGTIAVLRRRMLD